MNEDTLLIDIGNTRIKWLWHSVDSPVSALSQAYASAHNAQQLPEDIRAQWSLLPTPRSVRITNVAHTNLLNACLELMHQLWGDVAIKTAHTQSTHPLLTLNYDAAQMGSDRYVQLLGARSLGLGAGLVVIGAGTAITVDAVTEQGQHLGGIILPSIRLMRSALHQYTAKLPLSGGNLSSHHAPNNTNDALHTGAVLACTGAIEQFIQRYCEAINPQVLLCGGDAPELIGYLQQNTKPLPMQYAPALGLLGLLYAE